MDFTILEAMMRMKSGWSQKNKLENLAFMGKRG
jgi:hypothetical protein